MGALAIVEDFDVIEDLGAGLIAGGELLSVNGFYFEGAPEAFHGGVVVAVGFAAHGGDATGLGEGGPVVGAGVLDAAIGMAQQILGRRGGAGPC